MNLQQDVFIEKIVKRKKTGKDHLMIFGFISAYIALILLAVMFIQYTAPFLIFIIAGGAYGLFYLITNLDLEYEYICTNGHLDIDAIIHKRRRKRKMSMKAQDMEVVASVQSDEFKEYSKQSNLKTYDFGSNVDNSKLWFFVGTYKDARSLVCFEPDERIMKDLKRYNPSKVKYNQMQGL